MPLLVGEQYRPIIAKWACERLDHVELPGGFEAIGILDAEQTKLIAAILYTDFRPVTRTIEMWCVGEGNWLTPQKVRALFYYPFVELGVNRITLKIERSNKIARRFVKRLGFFEEGTLKEALGPNRDLVINRMLRKECRWLKAE